MMKKTILSMSLAAVCGLTSAQVNYKVTLKTDNTEITKVYLRSTETEEIIDSAECKGGQAVLEGQTEKPAIAILNLGVNQKHKGQVFFILDETPTVISYGNLKQLEEGSALNQKMFAAQHNVYEKFSNLMSKFQEKVRKVNEQYGQNIPDSILKPLQKEYNDLYEGRNNDVRKAAEDNKDNLVAAAFIGECIEAFGADYVKNFLASYPYKDAGILKSTYEYIAALDRKAEGAMFTDFTMNDMNGEARKLSDYVGKGNYVLVDFWASWCGPCRAEMPNVKKAYEQFHPKGFEIVGVSFDNNKASWQKATEQLGITWPQMSDLKGWQCEAGKIYGIRGIPATILFGPDGKIVATDLRSEALQKKLEEIYK